MEETDNNFNKASKRATTLKLNPLPVDFENMKVDLKNTSILPYSGVFEKIVDVEGTLRPYKFYVPEGMEACSPSLFLVPESGREPLEFLENSGWKSMADKYKLLLFIVESKDAWDVQSGENKYLNLVLMESQKRTYFLSYKPNCYILGYGDGATIAQQFAMLKPYVWAGMATFGDLDVSEKYMEEVGGKASELPHVPTKKVPVPVWLFISDPNQHNGIVIGYWKNANNSEDTYYSNIFTDYIYLPSQACKSGQINSENTARVQITVMKESQGPDVLVNEKVWTEFLEKTRRYIGIGNGDLRAYTDPEKLGAVRKSIVIDGYTREWYEYVPESVKADPDRKVPLVVTMHGRSGTGREYVGRSAWYKVAEDRGFIAVFPTGATTKINISAVPNTVWNIYNDNTMQDDLKFIKAMVEDIKSRNNIDGGRVYASGQSMGSMMSYNLAMCMPDVFTATGSSSGFILAGPDYYKRPEINSRYETPYMVFMGDTDHFLDGESSPLRHEKVKRQIQYWIDRFGTPALDQANTYKSGPYNHRVWYNKDAVPMIRYSVVDYMGHATLPEISYMIYDEFFSRFYRDSDGKIVYENGDINNY